MSLFVLRLFHFHRDMAVSELITCRSSQASRHRRGSGCADGCRRTFHSIKRGGRGEGAKKQLVSVRGGELLIDFHGSCLGLITHKATVIKKSATGNLRGDVARISRGFHQIPELIESQSVPIAEAVFSFFLFSFSFLSASVL